MADIKRCDSDDSYYRDFIVGFLKDACRYVVAVPFSGESKKGHLGKVHVRDNQICKIYRVSMKDNTYTVIETNEKSLTFTILWYVRQSEIHFSTEACEDFEEYLKAMYPAFLGVERTIFFEEHYSLGHNIPETLAFQLIMKYAKSETDKENTPIVLFDPSEAPAKPKYLNRTDELITDEKDLPNWN